MKKLTTLLALIILTLTSCNTTQNDKNLNIACNIPLTGYVAFWGEWFKAGLDMALNESKANIDSLGMTVNIDYQDNKGVTKDALSIFQKQILKNPDFYMSGLTSQTMAILEQVKSKEIPHFLWSFTPLFLTEGDGNFRTLVNYGIEAQHYIDFCKSKNAKRIAILHINLVGAKEQCQEYLIPELKKYDPSMEFYVDEYPVENVNLKSNIIKIKEYNPDVLIVSGFKANLISALKEIEIYNIKKNTIICSMDLLDAVGEDLANNLVEEVSVVSPAFNIEAMQTKEITDWSTRFQMIYNRKPVYVEAYAYDSFNIMYQAFKDCNGNKELLNDALLNIDMDGITGRLKFMSNGELESNTFLCKYNNGKLKEI